MSNFPSKAQLESLRAKFPAGTRVELSAPLDDPHSKLTTGDRGTVTAVFANGDIGVAWDAGSSLHLIPEHDSFWIVPSLSAKAIDGLLAVRDTARTNMFDLNAVQVIANELGFYETVIAIEENRKLAANFILTGETEERQ